MHVFAHVHRKCEVCLHAARRHAANIITLPTALAYMEHYISCVCVCDKVFDSRLACAIIRRGIIVSTSTHTLTSRYIDCISVVSTPTAASQHRTGAASRPYTHLPHSIIYTLRCLLCADALSYLIVELPHMQRHFARHRAAGCGCKRNDQTSARFHTSARIVRTRTPSTSWLNVRTPADDVPTIGRRTRTRHTHNDDDSDDGDSCARCMLMMMLSVRMLVWWGAVAP